MGVMTLGQGRGWEVRTCVPPFPPNPERVVCSSPSSQVMVTKQREDLRQQLPALKDLDDMLLVSTALCTVCTVANHLSAR